MNLTPVNIRGIESLEHVARVTPTIRIMGDLHAKFDGKSEGVMASSVAPESRFLSDRLIAGRLSRPGDDRVAIVHEFLLYRWGLMTDAEAAAAVGKTIRLEFRPHPPDTFDISWVLRMGNRVPDERQARRWNRG